MPLIEDGANSGQQELTLEQKQDRVSTQIKRKSFETFQGLIGSYTDIKKRVWDNPQGLTPQEVMDSLGTSAAELFQLSSLLVTTVNTAQPDTLDASQPYEFTINPDGTVTVGAEIVAEGE
jgi:hypothetical protein